MKEKNQNTALVMNQNPKFTELVQKSGVELTKAESHVSAFHPSLAELAELSRPLAELDKKNPTVEHAKIARENRLKIVKVRTGSEAIKDDRKKVLLSESNLIQSAHNLVKDACILTESEYEEIEKHQERLEEKTRLELRDSRTMLLNQYSVDSTYLPLAIMGEDDFQKLLASEKEKFEAVKLIREKQEAEKLEAERLAEEKLLADIEAEKERIRLQAIENEKLQAELEKQRKEAERLASIAEAERIESQKKLDAAKKEADRIQAEKQKELDILKAKQAEIDLKNENERLAKIAQQKEALLAPDKEKINALFISIRDFKFPECETTEARIIISDIQEGFKIILAGIKEKSKSLK